MKDFFARGMTSFFKWTADTFFAKRYGHRAVVLETVAAVPAMVAGMMLHLKSLRRLRRGYDPYIDQMLEEAKNERMHLMFFLEIAQPNAFERFLITAAQFIFWHFYLLLYICSSKTAHRMVAYFEQEAVNSYTEYLNFVESGKVEDVVCPASARNYYGLGPKATLATMIRYVRADEQRHSETNMRLSL
tara:strand:+ start:515 stop:1078 length:564 start_codon:yes stop_codon:yes gene_type:complete